MALANKRAVVFGGSGGIGLSIGQHLLGAGVTKLFVLDVCELTADARSQLLARNEKAEVFYARCNITDRQQVTELLQNDVRRALEQVDILVNSVGIGDETAPEKLISVNLVGVLNSTLAGIELMSRSKGGRGGAILNVASIAGLMPFPCLPVYAASKFGVVGLTRSFALADSLKEDGLKFVAICPGFTRTKLLDNLKPVLPVLEADLTRIFSSLPHQDTSAVGACVVRAVLEGDSGAMWLSNKGENTIHTVPDVDLN